MEIPFATRAELPVMQSFFIVGDMIDEQTFAEGNGIRELQRLIKTYGGKHWRKRKGFACIQLEPSGIFANAELHWYECHGIGKVEMKIKALL